jgi:hypothetical protein
MPNAPDEAFPKIALEAPLESVERRLISASSRLNRLALQVRTVRALLREDAAAARELFDRIDASPPPLACADLFQYELREYYRLAAEIAPRHRDLGRSDVVFVQRLVTAAQTSAQVSGAITLIDQAGTRGVPRDAVVPYLVQVLERGDVLDDPGRGMLLFTLQAGMGLAARAGGAREALTTALRDYAIRQWQGPCRALQPRALHPEPEGVPVSAHRAGPDVAPNQTWHDACAAVLADAGGAGGDGWPRGARRAADGRASPTARRPADVGGGLRRLPAVAQGVASRPA